MDYRLGTCSSCGAQYKIPASFVPNQARCRSCTGVVEIGPIRAASEPLPERRPAGASAERERSHAPVAEVQDRVARGRPARAERSPDPVEAVPTVAADANAPGARADGPTQAASFEATKPPPSPGRADAPGRSTSAQARRVERDAVVDPVPLASRSEATQRRRASEPARGAPVDAKKKGAPVVAIAVAVALGLAAVGWWAWSGTREADARAADKQPSAAPSGARTSPNAPANH